MVLLHLQLTCLLYFVVRAGVKGPAGVKVSCPAGVASYIHRPAQGQQELQEVGLDAGGRLHVPQDLRSISTKMDGIVFAYKKKPLLNKQESAFTHLVAAFLSGPHVENKDSVEWSAGEQVQVVDVIKEPRRRRLQGDQMRR